MTSSVVKLPPVPAKRYFTLGEVAELAQVEADVIRSWENEFSQLRPIKKSTGRRFYRHHELMLIRRIRELLITHGYSLSGVRERLDGESHGRYLTPLALRSELEELLAWMNA